MELEITRKQQAFINAGQDEVLFGGAAGGGKSYGQLVDAMLFALRYPGSKQLALRRTFPELQKSLIRVSLELYPREIYEYNDAKHTGRFKNGSILDFGYCFAEKDVNQYQSAEYDVIRVDELTHFTEYQYLYLASRLRGANGYPKQMKSSTNPGNVGHTWVKDRFVGQGTWGKPFETETGSRVFIPSKVYDNRFLMAGDPDYIKRLERLPERERRALKDGDWDIFEGQFFSEFNRELHVCEPFVLPSHWRIYRVVDYGLDMLCCLWIAVDEQKRAVVYKELYEPGLIVSEAARRILEVNGGDPVYMTLAPPDLWGRRQETGRKAVDIFAECGVPMTRANAERVQGWLSVKEWLAVRENELLMPEARLRIFDNCVNLIRTLPALVYDEKNPNDCATEPHELTHAPDALRYFCVNWATAAEAPVVKGPYEPVEYEEQVADFVNFGI